VSIPSRCGSCGAPVLWARTETGKAIPLDAVPTERGNLVLADGVVHVARILGHSPQYVPHFATCPHAGQWRRGGK
jgi:hypothetical protein